MALSGVYRLANSGVNVFGNAVRKRIAGGQPAVTPMAKPGVTIAPRLANNQRAGLVNAVKRSMKLR